MYIHLGNKKNIREKDIIGIFDMDNVTISRITQKFLVLSEQKGILENTVSEIPKSVILTKDKVYLSQLNPKSVFGRLNDKKII